MSDEPLSGAYRRKTKEAEAEADVEADVEAGDVGFASYYSVRVRYMRCSNG